MTESRLYFLMSRRITATAASGVSLSRVSLSYRGLLYALVVDVDCSLVSRQNLLDATACLWKFKCTGLRHGLTVTQRDEFDNASPYHRLILEISTTHSNRVELSRK